MPKFSIIVPVYNVEEYIDDCLRSIKNQTFKDYEVIVVNDGTKDNSMDIVKKYDVEIINQENGGLSAARNTGVKKAKGDYLIFLDSDDFIEEELLEKINDSLEDNPDIVRFQIQEVYELDKDKDDLTDAYDYNEVEYNEEPFNTTDGVDAFSKIVKYHFIENAWCYAIKRSYYIKNKFEFTKGTYHEDYGLIPLVIIKADKVKSISYIGYNYRQRENSIMSSKDYKKTIKKVDDFYNHYTNLIKEIDKLDIESSVIKSYLANSLLIKICELDNPEYKEYLNKIRKDKVIDNLLGDTTTRKIKKLLHRVSPKLTIKFIK